MVLKNVTKNTVVADDLKISSSFLDQMFGLLRKSNPRSLLFRTRFGIHTFGLKNSINVLVLDKNWRVVKMATVKPNQLLFWNIKYRIVIELPSGAIKKSVTKTADKLELTK